MGFDGIAVSVMGANNPLGIILSATLFGVIKQGGIAMCTLNSIPKDLITVLRGLIILFATLPFLVGIWRRRQAAKAVSIEIGREKGPKVSKSSREPSMEPSIGKTVQGGVEAG